MTNEETEEEKKIPDLTPEQEAEWDGPKEQTFDEEDPPCLGYYNDCECDSCLQRSVDEDEDEDEDEDDEDEDDEDEDDDCDCNLCNC